MKMKKVLLTITLFFMFILPVSAISNEDVVDQTTEFYINDYADIVSPEVEEHIININKNLHKETGAQVVVVTVNSLNGYSVEEYATTLFRKFGIGDKEKNNGVLFLISKGDRLLRIEVGYGLEGAIPDGKAGRIRDTYITPYLKNDDWDNGVKNGFDAIIVEVCKEYNIEVDESILIEGVSDEEDYFTPIMNAAMVSFVIGIIFGISIKKPKAIIFVIIFIISLIIMYFSIFHGLPFAYKKVALAVQTVAFSFGTLFGLSGASGGHYGGYYGGSYGGSSGGSFGGGGGGSFGGGGSSGGGGASGSF